jgi:hypothetical protein
MTDDIVARLRLRNDPSMMLMCYPSRPAPDMLCYEAADRIEQLEAALQKYADEEYNGYNACGKHARAALEGEKKDD